MENNIAKEYGNNPVALFHSWLKEAEQSEPSNPNGMALATTGEDGKPQVRHVLLKGLDERGFVFYTNYESNKGRALVANPYAALCFYWKSLERQVRINGPVEQVSDKEADEYFSSRPRDSRIGAWASQQSRRLESPQALEQKYEEYKKKFEGRNDIPRPPYWSGFRLKPESMEFWIHQPHRLHTRFLYVKDGTDWKAQWLNP